MGILLLDSPDPASATGRTVESYAGAMRALLPPGKLWRFIGESVIGKLLLGCAEEFVRIDQRAADLLNESDPTTALELLPEYEGELDVGGAVYLEERRGRVVARLVARQRFRPLDFQQALAQLLALDPVDVVVIVRSAAFAASLGDQREIFTFFVYRDPSLAGTYFVSSAQAQLDKMKPSHTVGYVIESIDFLCDDPHSLCDRDLLGA